MNKPAFPNITPDMPVDGHPGMTMRQWYKARAPFGQLEFSDPKMAAEYVGIEGVPEDFDGLIKLGAKAAARFAGEFADAMLAEDEAHEAGGNDGD